MDASFNSKFSTTAGGPLSAVLSSLVSKSLLDEIRQNEQSCEQPEYHFDEFGFRVDQEDGAEPESNKILAEPLTENKQQKLQWQAHLEFTFNSNVEDMSWDKIGNCIPRSDKLTNLVEAGVPHSMRPQVWLRLSGALQKRNFSKITYEEIAKASDNGNPTTLKAIEKDLLRTIPSNICFSDLSSPGIPRLRRILRGLAWFYPDNGYCQGVGMIVAHLLLFMEEEEVFWMMCAIVEDLVPPAYFSNNLFGVTVDQRVMRQLVAVFLPQTEKTFQEHDIELRLITLHWFITLFAGVIHTKILLRVWDLFFMDGSIVLFRIAMGMLNLREDKLTSLDNSADVFNLLSDIPSFIDDFDVLFSYSMKTVGSLSQAVLDTHRTKHHAYLSEELGKSVSEGLKTRKQMIRRRSFIGKLFTGSSVDETFENLKAKNIKQTEIISDMKKAIQNILNHFQKFDEIFESDLTPDYSPESHMKDHDDYMNVSAHRHQRARALLDFERSDNDELGFRKNDIITISSMKDEHCWIGELNGLQGWFPAKFVELLDERSKIYSAAGDGCVNHSIIDLVRGGLCPALLAIFENGLKRPMLLGSTCHPWQFIEEAALHEVKKDFDSVFSRLVLCKTYRLDEDGKVLTPEELLFRCIQAVNMSHNNVHAQMDVKFRSLICFGLNEQVLHLWLEILCSSLPIVQKWYHPWSYFLSPGWVQIKCELRVLSKFTFYLPPDSELPKQGKSKEALKEGVRDMLVKHHLFSWDL